MLIGALGGPFVTARPRLPVAKRSALLRVDHTEALPDTIIVHKDHKATVLLQSARPAAARTLTEDGSSDVHGIKYLLRR